MRLFKYYLMAILLLILFSACGDQDLNTTNSGEDILEIQEHTSRTDFPYTDTVYVPIYSDIYSETKATKYLLTATLSIRNTSLADTLYIKTIDYYNTAGDMVNKFLDQTIVLSPMQSIEYVIEEKDNTGGSGANFIIDWAADTDEMYPIFQGVMITTTGPNSISFLTEGKSITHKGNQK